MRTRTLVGYVGSSLAATMLAAVVGFAVPAYADTYTFFTPTGAQGCPADGSTCQPVSAEAVFVTTPGSITVTLTNLLANPTSASQLLSDIFFTASGLTGGTGSYTPIASYVALTGTVGTFTASWALSTDGTTYHLTGLGDGTTGPKGLIIGPGPYTNANPSLTGAIHNPFIDQTATFTLAVGGSTAAVIDNVVFSFGTAGGENVAAVPIPAAVWLFGSGLLGLIGIARRKLGSAQSVAA